MIRRTIGEAGHAAGEWLVRFVRRATRSVRWAWAGRWFPALLIGVAISVPGWVAWQLEHDARAELQACIGTWADDSSYRTERLLEVNSRWRRELTVVLVLAGDPATRGQAEGAYRRWLQTTRDLDAQLRDNPVPEPPRLRC